MTIIAGALQLTQKIAKDTMTPISDTFAVDINAKLDRNLMKSILEKGHSRVPVYYDQSTNIIGMILVKNLLTTHPADEAPVKSVTIRKILRYIICVKLAEEEEAVGIITMEDAIEELLQEEIFDETDNHYEDS
ncbi:hypothetical protein GIB67_035118 [Kingdonia uniflora]|nr:hypothetical protein GIB67_035118 [Kingdonia uniflora]